MVGKPVIQHEESIVFLPKVAWFKENLKISSTGFVKPIKVSRLKLQWFIKESRLV
jgi:hypothetical protein